MHAWGRFHVRYLNFTLIFLLFDMEMVYMYPWAVVFMEVGWKAFMEMGCSSPSWCWGSCMPGGNGGLSAIPFNGLAK